MVKKLILQILTVLADGKITAEEALGLLTMFLNIPEE